MIFTMSFFFFFKITKVVVPEPCIFFRIPASIAEAAAVIPNGAKMFFAKGTATFINGPADLLNNDPKNPSENPWTLESYKSVDMLLLSAFLSFPFCLVVSNNS